MATLNLSMIIKAIDYATAPVRRIKEALKGLGDNRGMKMLQSYAKGAGKALGWAADKAKELAKWAVVGATAAITAFGVSVFRTGIQFENFLARLEQTEGSAQKAKAAMAWVQKFAADTPYQLATVMDAFAQLRSYGIEPTDGTLRTLGDAASGVGKDLMSAVEALSDAITGEFERLKEFGIRARVQGSQVLLGYTQDSKQMVLKVKNNATEINRALLGIWNNRFAGGMARQSKTLGGMLSNLADWWTGFKRQIADAGVFDYVKGKIGGFLASLQTPAGAAKAAALAKNISDGMIKGLQSLERAFKGIDVGKFISDLASIVGGVAAVVKAIGGLGTVFDAVMVGSIARFGYVLGTIAVAIGGVFGIAAAPIAAVVAAITAVIAVGYLVVRHWSGIKKWFAKLWVDQVASWSATTDRWKKRMGQLWEGIKSLFAIGAKAVWSVLPPWFRALVDGGLKLSMMLFNGKPVAPAASPQAALGQPRFAKGAWDGTQGPRRDFGNRLNGQITVRLTGDARHRVDSVQASGNSGLDLAVDRGLMGYSF